MGRKAKPIKNGATVPTAFRIDRKIARWLDKKARQLTEQSGLPATRSDVVRIVLKRAMEADKPSAK